MITTRESINYQFSLIYGYSSPNHDRLIVGNIISPGNLSENLIKDLSKDVIKYLTEYNAMLRDYTGAELYSVEYELINFKEKGASTKIYPKSMLLIPGNYKECESLMLALKPEKGYLNVHKSNQSINKISKLFFDVEDYANHPDLDFNEKKEVYNSFASRFSQKLFGQLMEQKWNKKLIGLSESMPTDNENLDTYCKLKSNIEINWHRRPIELNIKKLDFGEMRNPFEGKRALEHLKFNITEPSAGFITEKTLQLGSNLLNLANYGTIDEFQSRLIKYILIKIENTDILKIQNELESQIISNINSFLEKIKSEFEDFILTCRKFLTSGEKGKLEEIIQKLKIFVRERVQNEIIEREEIYKILKRFMKKIIIEKENVRANDLDSSFNYFSELINRSFEKIKENLPKHFLDRRLKRIIDILIKDLKLKLEKEQKPAKLLGYKFIDKFRDHLLKIINNYSIFSEGKIDFEKIKIQKNFFRLVSNHLDDFFNNVDLGIKEIISFAEINLGEDLSQIDKYIEKFKRFSGEIHYLLSYILRYSTINRFLKEIPDKEISDPVSFSTKFHRFLEKRLAGINLDWKSVILEWIKDYTKLFFKLETNQNWTLNEIYKDFINYLEEKENNVRDVNKFSTFLDGFISGIDNNHEKTNLMKFYEQYTYFIGIKTEFPKYLRKIIEKEIANLNINLEDNKAIKLISSEDNLNNFYDYLKENELKYFSDLIPIPSSLILRHKLTNEELSLFKGDLFEVFNFKFWGERNIALKLSDNFREVYREWIREL